MEYSFERSSIEKLFKIGSKLLQKLSRLNEYGGMDRNGINK